MPQVSFARHHDHIMERVAGRRAKRVLFATKILNKLCMWQKCMTLMTPGGLIDVAKFVTDSQSVATF